MQRPKDAPPLQSEKISQPNELWTPGDAYPVAALGDRILYESSGVLAIDKPAGLPTSGKHLEDPDCLQFALMQRHNQMVWAVHQLDADTSGINFFALEKPLVPMWQGRLQYPNARKVYLAIVEGQVAFDNKRVELPIGPASERGLGVCEEGKRAVTEIRLRAHGQDCSLLEVMIETGRTHQIRIHLAHLGHPLVGEDWYAPDRPRRHSRQALHAWNVSFGDEREPRSLSCTVPRDLVELAEHLGLETVLLETLGPQ
jgi:23S rRNA-/tRNA-specific pseudouridylate synthase